MRCDPRVPDAAQQIGLAFVAARDRLAAIAKVEQDGEGVGHAERSAQGVTRPSPSAVRRPRVDDWQGARNSGRSPDTAYEKSVPP
jgi:hypothetical protein